MLKYLKIFQKHIDKIIIIVIIKVRGEGNEKIHVEY
jgi:hypothetical protein